MGDKCPPSRGCLPRLPRPRQACRRRNWGSDLRVHDFEGRVGNALDHFNPHVGRCCRRPPRPGPGQKDHDSVFGAAPARRPRPTSTCHRGWIEHPGCWSRARAARLAARGGPWARQGSNLRPKDYESPALTTELRARNRSAAAGRTCGVGTRRSGGGTRTHNKRLNRPVLCRLSYPGIRP